MCFKYSTLWFSAAVLLLVLGVKASAEERENGPATDLLDNYLENAKRSHNILRFGKRMIDEELDQKRNHNMIHFGKRSFGISDENNRFPELLRILRSEDRDWWKRGHNIMRFGKRAEDHHFIHFGKKNDEDMPADENVKNDDAEVDHFLLKRPQHSFIRFGKRLLYSLPSKSEESNLENKPFLPTTIHFEKETNEDQDYNNYDGNDNENFVDSDDDLISSNSDKRSHSMIHFGKREEPYESDEKRSHLLMHFGKRYNEEDVKRNHKLIRFGKRPDLDEDKRSHQLMHFGKRYDVDEKKSHALMHFGKRFSDDNEKRSHSLMHFGKRFNTDFDKRGHSMIHFGKRMDGNVEKRSAYKLFFYPKKQDNHHHNIMHFGKRDAEAIKEEKNDNSEVETSRTKRSSKIDDISKSMVPDKISLKNIPQNRSQPQKDN